MRESMIDNQLPLMQAFIDHEHSRELQAIGKILDANPEIEKLIDRDLCKPGTSRIKGRRGLNATQVLRALVVKQMNSYSYEELSFHLVDSASYRSFCRFGGFDRPVGKSALQENIGRLKDDILEKVNRSLTGIAARGGIETGRKTRTDSTVVESHIHSPTDSSLLFDGVRTLTRLMKKASEPFGFSFSNHTRRAKRRALEILHAKNKKSRKRGYRDLLKVSQMTLDQARELREELAKHDRSSSLVSDLDHSVSLVERVMDQARKRVLLGETVASQDKVVSLFEPHTDIIVKDKRDTYYGHKITLTTGASSLILDCVIQEGNPADSTLAVPMIGRQIDIYGRPPRQASLDGGFASGENLKNIKGKGVKDCAFSKKRGLRVEEMVKSLWVYKRLRNFRAGIEGCISFLKRCFGLNRCTWKGPDHFKSYVWGSIISANLLIMARHKLA